MKGLAVLCRVAFCIQGVCQLLQGRIRHRIPQLKYTPDYSRFLFIQLQGFVTSFCLVTNRRFAASITALAGLNELLGIFSFF